MGSQGHAGVRRARRGPPVPRRDRGLTVGVPAVAASEIERVFRAEYCRAVAGLIRVFGDIDVAEDAAQDAFAAAAQRRPGDGLPPRPTRWNVTTARDRTTDRLRPA